MKLTVNGLARAVVGAGVLAVAALLASCGGGSQVETFHPSRVIAFGDEFSVINPNGSKYTVNALAAGSTTQFDCGSNPIWIQMLAVSYGLVFPQCPGTGSTVPVSRICAISGCHAAPNGPINAHTLSAGAARSTDSATVCSSVFGDAR